MIDSVQFAFVGLMIACGICSFFLATFVMVMKFRSIGRKKALAAIEFGIAILLIAHAVETGFDGDTSTLGYWMVRVTTFLVHIFTIAISLFLTSYVTNLFMETGRFERLPKRLLAGFVLPSIEMSLVVLSLFTGMFYSFDEANHYIRGPLFPFEFVFPVIVLLSISIFVVQNRKMIRGRLAFALCFFTVSTLVSMVGQAIVRIDALVDFSCWAAGIILFYFALSDQNTDLVKAAFTERATGLPNPDGFLMEVDEIIHNGDITKYSAFYLDIVRMSYINNKYGKKNGDEVILQYAAYLKKHVEKDEIVGRLGGNFFVALVKKTNVSAFLEMIQGIPAEVDFMGQKETIYVKAYAGGYEINKSALAAGQILSNTATALAYAKNTAHKPYVFLDKELEAELEKIRAMESAARRGLKNNEFEPFYQPKVDARTNTLAGAEALVRWRHEEKLISPAEFVPIMEKNGNICDLDFYMLDAVCKDMKEWMARGLEPVRVSVNFSRRNLGNPILAEEISKVVEKHQVPKNLIQIEITETLDEFPMSYLVGVVEALQRYGLTVAIDDFGTGSSSLNLLKQVQFDVLKIDKSFVDYTSEKEKNLLKDIVHMARSIDIKVVAEGVEQPEQVEDLRQLNCFLIQGYVYDRPLEKSAFEKRLMQKKYA